MAFYYFIDPFLRVYYKIKEHLHYTISKYLIIPIIWFLWTFLEGKFVEIVKFFGKNILYIKFLLVSVLLLSASFWPLWCHWDFEEELTKERLSLESPQRIVSSLFISETIEDLIQSYPYFLFFLIFFSKNTFISTLISLLLIHLFYYPFIFILTSLYFLLRGERYEISSALLKVFQVFISTNYSFFSIYGKNIFVAILLPQASILDILRELIILNTFDLKLFLISIFSFFIQLFLSLKLLEFVYSLSRKKGTIFLF